MYGFAAEFRAKKDEKKVAIFAHFLYSERGSVICAENVTNEP
jgi:hypothetical protein